MYIDKSIPCNKGNYYSDSKRKNKIEYIVLHYTGNNNDKASSNCKYFQTNGRNASAHYFVDETSIYQSVEDDYVAWSVGGNKYSNTATTGGGKFYGKCTNNNSISIEMCNAVSSIPIKTKDNIIWLLVELMKKYSIDINHVILHFDVTGKICPKYFVDYPEKFKDFKAEVEAKMKGSENIVTKAKVVINGVEKEVNVINVEGNNFIKLQDLRDDKITIGYDSTKKMPTITTK